MTARSNTGMRRYATTLPPVSPRRDEERRRDPDGWVPNSTLRRARGRRTVAPKPTGPDDTVKLLVLKRALRLVDGLGLVPCCEVCATPVLYAAYSLHHRRGREGTRTDNSPANLLVCCGRSNVEGCHGQIHQRRSWSQPLGLWLPRNGVRLDPAVVAVTIDRGARVVHLGADGQYHDNPPEGA
jgi:hypothetical protein